MEKCYEFFDCKKIDCIRHKTDEIQCWEIDGTWCDVRNDDFKLIQAKIGSKKEACKVCTYYQKYYKE